MKKRIFMLALVVGVMLSVCGSAVAATEYSIIKTAAEYTNLYKLKERAGLNFSVRVRAEISPVASAATTSKAQASGLKWELTLPTTFNLLSKDTIKITPDSDDFSEPYVAEAVISGTVLTTEEMAENLTDTATDTLTIKVTLTSKDASGVAQDTNVVDQSKTIVFSAGTGTETRNSDFPGSATDVFTIKEVFQATEDMKADPEGDFWDGIDPTYPSGDVASKAQAALEADKGAKPKLGKIDKSKLTFKAGTAGTLTIPIEGGCPVVDVYIAAKDAAKLWPDSFDKNSDNVQLNKANIKALNIPFRINAENITTATGKTASSTLTLAYNGANVAYKGFPITIEMTNSAASKPVKKAIKINVTPNDKVPGIYRYEDKEFTVNGLSFDMVATGIVGTGDSLTTITKESVNPSETVDSYPNYTGTLTFVKIESADLTSEDNDGTVTWKVGTLDSGATAAHVYYNFTYTAPALTLYDKKVKPKQVWDISVPLTGSGDVQDTNNPYEFYVSGDYIAPYIVTTKGQDKNGVSVDIQQPVYDKYGNVTTPGKVTIGGTLENLEKETKTGITITATNPSTKKKGSVKINVIGKVPAKFDKSKFVDASDAADYANASDWKKGVYSTVLSTKAGAAGKVPGASFKAKGSKTIYYDVYDGLDGLKAAGLSLDVKKGKLIALTTKDKVVPTVDDDGNYSPVDLIVHAYNDIDYEGSDSFARALIGVTGAKPSLADKTVTFKTADYVNGTIKTFKLNAGKEKPIKTTSTASNVKVRLADSSSTALSDLGLALIDWTSIDCVVSNSKKVAKGAAIGETTFKILSTDETTVLGDQTSAYVDSGNLSCDAIADGTSLTVLYGSTTVSGDESYKNLGAIIVKDKSKMTETAKLKVNLTLDNLGAAGKGAITVTIGKAPTTSSSNSALPYSTVKVDANATAKKTNGTASLTYNGALPGEADADADESAEDVTVTVGEPRTAADLTAGQQAYLAAKGLKVIAVLPEISANVEGQNKKFEVTLDEDAPEGAKMVYVPFPQDVEETEDDSIADFYDADGEPIDDGKVPAEKAITVEPWLRADVVYQPVIAAEAE